MNPRKSFGRAGWPHWLVALWLALAAGIAWAADAPAAPDANKIEVFVREGCPHCAKAEEFLGQLAKERPELVISIRDVTKEPAAMDRLIEVVKQYGGGAARVPAILVRGQLIMGYSEEASTDKLIL
ncbi:MAG: glutaredoxin, partial [Burkholderiales bacterium]|nr:glutaredoxin [Burkholderiales bacterium]